MLKDKQERKKLLYKQRHLHDTHCRICPQNVSSNNNCVYSCPIGLQLLAIGEGLSGGKPHAKHPSGPGRPKKVISHLEPIFDWVNASKDERIKFYESKRERQYSVDDIAALAGIGQKTLKSWRYNNGYSKDRKMITTAQEKELRRMVQRGWSYKACAEYFKVPYRSFLKYIRRNNILEG